jgi:hypothetical protein
VDPTVRYTIWTILIGKTFSGTANYACIQTQAQRYMCVKDIKSAQRYLRLNNCFKIYLLKELLGLIM